MSAAEWVGLIPATMGLLRLRVDARRAEKWLRKSTSATGETHRTTVQISTALRIPKRRAAAACLHSRRVFRDPDDPDNWSVWQERPRSVYEDRGVLIF